MLPFGSLYGRNRLRNTPVIFDVGAWLVIRNEVTKSAQQYRTAIARNNVRIMKNKWIIKAAIGLMIMPAICPAVCQAQLKPAKPATPVITAPFGRPTPDTSKLKGGSAPVKPKEAEPIDMKQLENRNAADRPQQPGSAPMQPVKGFPRAHVPVHTPVKDSGHGSRALNPGVLHPVSSTTDSGSRYPIHPQPLPSKGINDSETLLVKPTK